MDQLMCLIFRGANLLSRRPWRPMAPFPSMKAKRLRALLERSPLNYQVARQTGSHRRMEAPGRPRVTFAFHDRQTVGGGLVRKILIKDVGLAEDEARKLL